MAGEGARPTQASPTHVKRSDTDVRPINKLRLLLTSYIVSPRLRRNAGTSRSACSKLRIMASRIPSRAMTSGAGDEASTVCVPPNDDGDDGADATGSSCDCITIGGGSEIESKSSADVFTVKPAVSLRRRG